MTTRRSNNATATATPTAELDRLPPGTEQTRRVRSTCVSYLRYRSTGSRSVSTIVLGKLLDGSVDA
ncbi:hypothetical protein N7481_011097 [Penicillium waksmanii]|uniref:uncharacterized protein n=1 Tax=Penicillium waksmanii TaxID=69791 RepID=UPI0025478BEC|nr:uncharacterized protein N7481_011097 [Penicillium waksmanii]KAJ5973887.1 hypothetical protein N7481_011097 [Penicillium waksmanii]